MARELSIIVTARNMASGVLKDVRRDVGGIQSEARRGLQNTARNLTYIGGAAAAGISAVVLQSVKDASQLQQATGAVESVFGEHAAAIEAFAEQAAESAGLSARQVKEMAAVIGASLQGLGFSQEEAAQKAIELEERAADLAATFGGTTKEAIQAIASLMRGERDPIERYGVSLKQVDINAEMAARGLEGLEGQEKKLAEAQVALDLLMQQTARTQGQFARESDTLAGAQARLTAKLENTRAKIGDALLPVVAKLVDRLSDAVTDHMPEIMAFASELPGVFDDLIGIVENLPWDAIGTTFRLMGEGARAALGFFSSMPPWVQTAVLTGWGLNKLSGGALGNIVGSLASGLIKGVLGINAGVVNVNAATVNGAPGGGVAAAGKGGSLVGQVLKAALVPATIAGIGVAVGSTIGGAIHEQTVAPAREFMEGKVDEIASSEDVERIKAAIDTLDANLDEWTTKPPQLRQIMQPTIDQIAAQRDELQAKLDELKRSGADQALATQAGIRGVASHILAQTQATRDLSSDVADADANMIAAANRTTEAIRMKRWDITIPITVNTAVSVNQQLTVQQRTQTAHGPRVE